MPFFSDLRSASGPFSPGSSGESEVPESDRFVHPQQFFALTLFIGVLPVWI